MFFVFTEYYLAFNTLKIGGINSIKMWNTVTV